MKSESFFPSLDGLKKTPWHMRVFLFVFVPGHTTTDRCGRFETTITAKRFGGITYITKSRIKRVETLS